VHPIHHSSVTGQNDGEGKSEFPESHVAVCQLGTQSWNCRSYSLVLSLSGEYFPRQEGRSMLLRNDVLRTHVFWREEMAEVK
jgi:hypothetical protein